MCDSTFEVYLVIGIQTPRNHPRLHYHFAALRHPHLHYSAEVLAGIWLMTFFRRFKLRNFKKITSTIIHELIANTKILGETLRTSASCLTILSWMLDEGFEILFSKRSSNL